MTVLRRSKKEALTTIVMVDEEAKGTLRRTQFTLSRKSIPDGERFLQTLNGRFLPFAPISSVSPQNSCRFDPIYQVDTDHSLYFRRQIQDFCSLHASFNESEASWADRSQVVQ